MKFMQHNILKIICILVLLFSAGRIWADSPGKDLVTISGYVKDASNGEVLIGAVVRVAGKMVGTTTNTYGFYSLSIKPGEYNIQYNFIGYKTKDRYLKLIKDIEIDTELDTETHQLGEMKVVANKKGSNLYKPEMGSTSLPMQTISRIPAIMGEVDLIKAIQLLPGVQPTSEGSSVYSVRGGSGDQNLIMLDEATIYNASHFLGFFSIFNNDAINSVKLYKGDIPVWAGGRLSSLLDVRMKEGNNKRYSVSGGIGLLSSRLTVEGPVQKDKSSFIISGRRSYFDLFTALSNDEDTRNTKIYFYDINAKVNFIIGKKDRLYFSTYKGKDDMDFGFSGLSFGNRIFSSRWNHLYGQKAFSNLTLINSKYKYKLNFSSTESNDYKWKYHMDETGLKYYLGILFTPKFHIRSGFQWTFHTLYPGTVSSTGGNFDPYILQTKKSLEGATFMQVEQDIGTRIKLRYGVRWSLFANSGVDSVFVYNDQYEKIKRNYHYNGDYFNWQNNFEPRIGMSFMINNMSSFKASYARTAQYYQMATISTSGTPFDLWFSSSVNVKPQISDQWSVGYNRFMDDKKVELSAEVYYKNMQNTIDFKDHPDLYFNREMEGELRFGKSHAYGLECMAKLNYKRVSGWVSYAYTQSERKVNGIANNEWYTSPFERPHSVNIVLNYQKTEKNSIAINWVYLSGQPATLPVGRMKYGNDILPVYSGRNKERFPSYHRLDISYTHKMRDWGKMKQELSFSIYNVYGHHNTWAINFEQDENNSKVMNAKNTYLFSFVPSVTYNIKF